MVSCRPGFFLPVRVLSRLFRRLFLDKLADAHAAGRLQFLGDHADLGNKRAFAAFLAPLRRKDWFVYAKPPFAGPQAVLAYLSRYTHRVAISNRRLIALGETGVTFRYKDYRRSGSERYRTMTLEPGEFIRRFLLHVLPKGFHRIRHYGLLASAGRAANIAYARKLLAAPRPKIDRDDADAAGPADWRPPCPCCGGRMIIIETFDAAAIREHRHERRRHEGQPFFTAPHARRPLGRPPATTMSPPADRPRLDLPAFPALVDLSGQHCNARDRDSSIGTSTAFASARPTAAAATQRKIVKSP